MAGAQSPGQRPLSPHLQVWRWHVTMAGSILHRLTGMALYCGAIGLVVWLVAAASGPEIYTPVAVLLSTRYGQLALYFLFGCLAFHLANGVRHLVFDTGRGLNPGDADTSAWFAILFGIAAPVGLFLLLSFGR